MHWKRGFYGATFALLLALAGCATSSPDLASIGPKPSNYREIVAAQVRATFFDPYSIRDAGIAEPFPGGTVITYDWQSGEGWVVCLRANGKNRFGAYIGVKETAFVVRGGKVVHTLDETGALFCSNVRYEPFTIAQVDVSELRGAQ